MIGSKGREFSGDWAIDDVITVVPLITFMTAWQSSGVVAVLRR